MDFWINRIKHYMTYVLITFVILITLFSVVKLYRFFFPKQGQKPTIGTNEGVVNIYNERKRFLIPFIEAFGGISSDDERRAEVGGRAGVRMEF